ncbi:MAG: cupin domain-containing protein [Pseudomonas sp.]|uniref:cupin domain-containing protein n=1 Tax=Pseudomonas sp. TaxID=306 RepID=UPI003982D289
MTQHVINFANPQLQAIEREIADPAIVDAPYQSQTWRHFASPERGLTAGIWQAGVHKERCVCDYDELCHIIEGQVRLTDEAGSSQEFGPGSTFVVAAGFKGTWENLTPVRKIYMIAGA